MSGPTDQQPPMKRWDCYLDGHYLGTVTAHDVTAAEAVIIAEANLDVARARAGLVIREAAD